MQLTWHKYQYYEYEKLLARREVERLLEPQAIESSGDHIRLVRPKNANEIRRLVYFSDAIHASGKRVQTIQALLEQKGGINGSRQSTRFSVHGLHDYKGKFNPQVAKAMLNICGVGSRARVLDPFCGSGTSLVECAHLGIHSVGTDVNPLAVYLANAKLRSLGIEAKTFSQEARKAIDRARRSRVNPKLDNVRAIYLREWFPPQFLMEIERLREALTHFDAPSKDVLLAIASNLLREFSLQEPGDLRIRRRKAPLPEISFYEAFLAAVIHYSSQLAATQKVLGVRTPTSKALSADCRHLSKKAVGGLFDMALTSPPYAMALPYIDTQRLSLVWLDLIAPADILDADAKLVGSREIRGQSSKKILLRDLELNKSELPEPEIAFCRVLQDSLTDADGFRRVAVPRLLYRYFAGMAEAFKAIRTVMKKDARFCLIVGDNHTVLGGKRFDIMTPKHLASIAASRGWQHIETIELQTYRRYGLHASNATSSESMVCLEA